MTQQLISYSSDSAFSRVEGTGGHSDLSSRWALQPQCCSASSQRLYLPGAVSILKSLLARSQQYSPCVNYQDLIISNITSLWLIHVNVQQNQYSIVKQNKVKIKIKKEKQTKKKNITSSDFFESTQLVLAFSISSDSFVTSWTVACQVPLAMGFPRQDYWSEQPFSSAGDLPDPGIKPVSPVLQMDSLLLRHQGSQFNLASD